MTRLQLGTLTWLPAMDNPELVTETVAQGLGGLNAFVAAIDPGLADTDACAQAYEIDLAQSANCVIIHGQRVNTTTIAAVVIRACDRADINGVVRKRLNVRKASVLPLDQAISLTSMEYGGIGPIGLPREWPILIDPTVVDTEWIVVGSGIRGSKLAVPGNRLAQLPNVDVLDLSARRPTPTNTESRSTPEISPRSVPG